MKMLLYCTKAKPILSKVEYDYGDEMKTKYECVSDTKKGNEYLEQMGLGEFLNGKIVGECDFEIKKIKSFHKFENGRHLWWYEYKDLNVGDEDCDLLKNSCLTFSELYDYLLENSGYAIHIKELHIFEQPKELSDYYTFDSEQHINIDYCKTMTKAPQNMRYCYGLWQDHSVIGNRYFYKNILISICPEWLCKILNGEKTIEIRKKVLKEMLK